MTVITPRINLSTLREALSPSVATVADAEAARDNLIASGWAGYDVAHVPEAELFASAAGRIAAPTRTIAQCVAGEDDVLLTADALATDRDQDWNAEATTFTFADGSKLRCSGPTAEVL